MKTVLITGASSGIGWATAQVFSKNNYHVIMTGRNRQKLEALAEQIESPSTIYCADFNKQSDISELCQKILSSNLQVTGLNALINNAGMIEYAKLTEASNESWAQQFQVNFFATVELTKNLLPLLKKASPSYVVNITSTLAKKSIANTGAYSASKAAMVSWSNTAALEWAEYGVRVNNIMPGIVDTPIHEFHNLDYDNKDRQFVDTLQPLKRVGKASEIAQMAFYLTQKQSEWTTGSSFKIDGGIQLL